MSTTRRTRTAGTTDVERTRSLLDEAEARDEADRRELHDLFEFAAIAIFRSSRDGHILAANLAFARLLGYDAPDQLGQLRMARDVYVHPGERAAIIEAHDRSRAPLSVELRWRRRDGSVFWVLSHTRAVRDETGAITYFDVFALDITAQRDAQGELAASRRQLRHLAARIEAVRESERKVVAREIHDELGQALTALRMDLARLGPQAPPALAAQIEGMAKTVERSLDAVRRIATKLRPPILDDIGLAAAIEWQVEAMATRAGWRWTLDVPPDVALDDARATAVFRICQEALTNVARHARAQHVRVSLHRTPQQLLLRVADDGRGITAAELADQRALGLLGMRERALAHGGRLEVTPTHPGTAVELELPLRRISNP